MKKIFSHKNCIDGNACVWVMGKFFPEKDFEYYGIAFGTDYESKIFSNVEEGDILYFLDFTPTRMILERLVDIVQKIYIIDHHANANIPDHDKIISYIDETHCAAYNVFKYFYPNREIPKILNYIDVTDLIKTEAMNYYEIAAFVRTLEEKSLEKSLHDLENYKNIDSALVIETGKDIFKQDYLKMEQELGDIIYRQIEIAKDKTILLPLVKANIYDMGAEIDYKLKQLQEDPNPDGEIPYIACAYSYESDFVRLNIRTNPLYMDASQVAGYIGAVFGIAPGGGHRNAAVARFSFAGFSKLFDLKEVF